MDLENKMGTFNLLINKILRIAKSASNRNEKLMNICKLLEDNVAYYDWVGFYMADESKEVLTLGPFVGESTEHTSIRFGDGICGQAAVNQKTFIVQDVEAETNYLSCSPLVRSEIVVPIMKNDNVIGELDIDSHTTGPFTDEDSEFLENICNIVSQLF